MKKALITGSTGAIGEAIARLFHDHGYFVYLHYNSNTEKANALHSELTNSQTLQFDIANRDAVKNSLSDLEVDVLVNNAGITNDTLFYWMDEEKWDSVINTSINGTYNVTKNVMEHMITKKSGAIINVSSVSGLAGNAGQANYATAKAGLIGFTKTLSVELARYNIRVNAVAPGLIKSEMTKEFNEKDFKKAIPLRRFGTPLEVAETIYFLAEKGTYITGETINISGGMVR